MNCRHVAHYGNWQSKITNLFTWHCVTNIFDFIKTNHQFYIKMLRMIHNIFIKLCTLFGVLSFNITSLFRLFAKGKTFVYKLPFISYAVCCHRPHSPSPPLDLIKTNHQFRVETLRKLHDIYIKIGRLYDMLS